MNTSAQGALMKPIPVLLVAHDDLLWRHWSALDAARWQPVRGAALSDLQGWREQGRTLVVLDTGVPGLPPWNAPEWSATMAGLRLVVASPHPSDEEGTRVLAAGAHGYRHSHAPVSSLAQTLEVVASDGIWMGRSLVTRLLKMVSEHGEDSEEAWDGGLLTDREITVAECAANGQANAQIADQLGITERTVKAHLSSAFDKLKVSDRLQLALLVHGISARPTPRARAIT
jgi:DNA-binding NarL/FixJ family response regulator